VLDAATGDQVAVLAGQFEPAVFAAYLAALRQWYGAGLLVERNNHGHAVLLWLAEHGEGDVLRGRDGRPGWLSSGQGKPLAYDAAAEVLPMADVIIPSANEGGFATLADWLMGMDGVAALEAAATRSRSGGEKTELVRVAPSC